jgi:hypothetical protein
VRTRRQRPVLPSSWISVCHVARPAGFTTGELDWPAPGPTAPAATARPAWLGTRYPGVVVELGYGVRDRRAVLAGGCFWRCRISSALAPSVWFTRVGYTGGDTPHATYRNHGSHAEAIEITYDPSATTYRELLEFFFQSMTSAPRTGRAMTWGRPTGRRSSTSTKNSRVAEDTIADVDTCGLWPGKGRHRGRASWAVLGG